MISLSNLYLNHTNTDLAIFGFFQIFNTVLLTPPPKSNGTFQAHKHRMKTENEASEDEIIELLNCTHNLHMHLHTINYKSWYNSNTKTETKIQSRLFDFELNEIVTLRFWLKTMHAVLGLAYDWLITHKIMNTNASSKAQQTHNIQLCTIVAVVVIVCLICMSATCLTIWNLYSC